jgi:hypothetical protein
VAAVLLEKAMSYRRDTFVRCERSSSSHFASWPVPVNVTEAHKDERHVVALMMALGIIAAFVPSQVEREADELECFRP